MSERPCQNCGHPESDHRSGGLCETCIPPSDSTGRWSTCQEFVAPSTPKPSDAEVERAACAAVVPHTLQSLLARAQRIRKDINQIFLDAEHWNRLHPDETPIDPDPDGELRQALAGLPTGDPCAREVN